MPVDVTWCASITPAETSTISAVNAEVNQAVMRVIGGLYAANLTRLDMKRMPTDDRSVTARPWAAGVTVLAVLAAFVAAPHAHVY